MTPEQLAALELGCTPALDQVWRGTTYDDGTFDAAQLWSGNGRTVIVRVPAQGDPYADPVQGGE